MLPAIYKSSLYHPLLLSQPGTERHPINKAGHSGLPNTPFYWELAKHAGEELAGQAIQATWANNERCFSSSSSHGSWHPGCSEEGWDPWSHTAMINRSQWETRLEVKAPSLLETGFCRLFWLSNTILTDWFDFTIQAQYHTETYPSKTLQFFTVWRHGSIWASALPFMTSKRHHKSRSERAHFKDQARFESRGLCNCLSLCSFPFLEMHFKIHFRLQCLCTSEQTGIKKDTRSHCKPLPTYILGCAPTSKGTVKEKHMECSDVPQMCLTPGFPEMGRWMRKQRKN